MRWSLKLKAWWRGLIKSRCRTRPSSSSSSLRSLRYEPSCPWSLNSSRFVREWCCPILSRVLVVEWIDRSIVESMISVKFWVSWMHFCFRVMRVPMRSVGFFLFSFFCFCRRRRSCPFWDLGVSWCLHLLSLNQLSSSWSHRRDSFDYFVCRCDHSASFFSVSFASVGVDGVVCYICVLEQSVSVMISLLFCVLLVGLCCCWADW